MSDPRIIPASEAKRLRENTKNIGTWRVEHDDMEDQWDITWERHFSDFSATMQIGHAHGEGTARMFAAAPDLAHTVIHQDKEIADLFQEVEDHHHDLLRVMEERNQQAEQIKSARGVLDKLEEEVEHTSYRPRYDEGMTRVIRAVREALGVSDD